MATATSPRTEEPDSPAQRDRRRRILEAAVRIASDGGFEAVQMRTVAQQAGVALGTLYRYFPSKIHLLVSALGARCESGRALLLREPIPGDSPADRVVRLLNRVTHALQGDPGLTEALTRAFVAADGSLAEETRAVRTQLTALLVRAIRGRQDAGDTQTAAGAPVGTPAEATAAEVAAASVIGDVWLAAILSWVAGRAGPDEVAEHIRTGVQLVLRD